MGEKLNWHNKKETIYIYIYIYRTQHFDSNSFPFSFCGWWVGAFSMLVMNCVQILELAKLCMFL